MGFKVHLIDADVQPSLSKYYGISHEAANGLHKVVRDGVITRNEISEITIPEMLLPDGSRPVLDLIYSDSVDGSIQTWLSTQGDRVMRLKFPIHQSPYMREEGQYDVVIIDSPGAVSALQDAAVVAAGMLISPVVR